MVNINTREYWESRFGSGDWESQEGRRQTRQFAETQVPRLGLSSAFSGSLLDFGCGMGDAMPVYRKAFPQAKLIGVDISQAAIESCQRTYGTLGTFLQGDYQQVPAVDVIISSNVFEHLSNDKEIARELLAKCKRLYIIVPYRQLLVKQTEHVNSYDDDSFRDLADYTHSVFFSPGWSQYGWDLWYGTYALNLLRPFFGKRFLRRRKQVMFRLTGKLPGELPETN